jgi:hypothetical protein
MKNVLLYGPAFAHMLVHNAPQNDLVDAVIPDAVRLTDQQGPLKETPRHAVTVINK